MASYKIIYKTHKKCTRNKHMNILQLRTHTGCNQSQHRSLGFMIRGWLTLVRTDALNENATIRRIRIVGTGALGKGRWQRGD